MYHWNNQSPYCQCQRCPCCGKIVNQFTGNNFFTTGYGYGVAGSINCSGAAAETTSNTGKLMVIKVCSGSQGFDNPSKFRDEWDKQAEGK